MEKCGYVVVRNNSVKDGFWVINGKRQVGYAKSELSDSDRIMAVRDFLKAFMPSADEGR